MSINIVIGVGGTGAKVVESIIHATSIGLGPERLTVGFVDQDQSNGNVSRAREALEIIKKSRATWRTSGGSNFIEEGALLKSDIQTLGDGLWTPHPEAKASLAQILGFLDEDQSAFDLFFAKGPEEQDMRLDEGYRGRAHIGSAAITSAVAEGSQFWRDLSEVISSAKGGEQVRILLAGSVFGGTGAAGFPTLSRLIRRIIDDAQIGSNIHVGGILMLPYFKFSSPEDERANVARTEDLLPQTRGALRYYDSLFQREKVFDELFLVGWNPSFDLGYHEPGTGEQRNPALLPELLAALGAARFLNKEYEPSEKILVCARRSEEAIEWADLPSPDPSDDELVYNAIGRHLRFLAAWKLWRPILKRDTWNVKYEGHNWFKRQGMSGVDFAGDPPTAAIAALDDYAEKSIEWLASMKAYAQKQGLGWGLWNTDPLTDGEAAFDRPTKPISVQQSLTDKQLRDGWSKLILPREGGDPLPAASRLHYRLNTERLEGEYAGLGRFVAALHEFAAVRERGDA